MINICFKNLIIFLHRMTKHKNRQSFEANLAKNHNLVVKIQPLENSPS